MVTTQDDLEMDEETSAQPVENMDLYPVGKIEEVSKKEQQQRRFNSLGRSMDRRGPINRREDYNGRNR